MKNKIIQYIALVIILLPLLVTGCTAGQGTAVLKGGIVTGTVEINENILISDEQLPELLVDKAIVDKAIPINSYNLQTVSVNPSELIVEFTEKISAGKLKLKILKNKGNIVRKIGENTYKIKLTEQNNKNIISDLKANPLISCIEYDYPLYIQNIPADPSYSQQWNLKMLDMERVWDKFTGDKNVIVAVIDTGILPDHPDLKDNIIAGYDFVDGDTDPTDTSPYFSHGTHVAGIIGAVSNNNTGIAGINWQVKIMPIRVIGPEGNGGYSNLIEGINWAVEHGAQIINLSLAGSFYSEALQKAIQAAVDKGITVVAAAGNNGSTPILYPAKYPEVISVGAVGPEAEIAYYSNFGPNLDLVAPGGNSSNNSFNYNTILSTAGYLDSYQQPVYQYKWAEGTSMATPHVSGIIALLYSSGVTRPQDIKTRLKQTAIDLGKNGFDDKYGAGLINVKKALNIKDNSKITKPIKQKKDNNSTKDLNKIQIFTTYPNNEKQQNSTIVNPDNKGIFNMEIPQGQWTLIAWLDYDNNNKINTGDYYTTENITIKSGQTVSEVNLTLGKLIRP